MTYDFVDEQYVSKKTYSTYHRSHKTDVNYICLMLYKHITVQDSITVGERPLLPHTGFLHLHMVLLMVLPMVLPMDPRTCTLLVPSFTTQCIRGIFIHHLPGRILCKWWKKPKRSLNYPERPSSYLGAHTVGSPLA